MRTAEKMAAIHEGATIESVIAQLGQPSVKIAMFEEGKLAETLRFDSKGTRLGSILLENGVVVSVEQDLAPHVNSAAIHD